jgi:glutathione-regulated potassium-efflux system ancillary protein KefC/glutathione-regulated potassium-efflux system protein KefB
MNLLEQAGVFLLTAVALVPLFRRWRIGAVLGYLVGGMVIGPWGLHLVGDVEGTMEIAEFGVVLLLFVIGLELEPRRLWVLRRSVFGLGGAQVVVTALAIGGIARLFGLPWPAAAVAGVALAMSSTALVLSSLAERGQLTARHGREAFAVLLFQDLAVIPVLALLPLLAPGHADEGGGWQAALKGLGAIVVVIGASRVLVRPVLRLIARHGGREVFTAAALLLVVGAALFTRSIGLSMSLGAFLAGVLVADSEFRHELEADIEPFKGLLLGLFFMSVGMSARLGLLAEEPLLLLAVAMGLVAVKVVVMWALARVARIPGAPALRLGIALGEGGEFAFVLFTMAASLGVIGEPLAERLVLAVTLSLLLAPLLFAAQDRLLDPWLERRDEPEYDAIDAPANPVIIAGYGRIGQIISRVLRMCGVSFTAIEASYQQVDFVRRYGASVYYGDASRLELLEAAKAGEAKLFVLAIDDVEASVRTAEVVRRHFPDLAIVARARNRVHAFRLRDLGVRWIVRETFASSGARPPPPRRGAARRAIRRSPRRGGTDPDLAPGGGPVARAVRVGCSAGAGPPPAPATRIDRRRLRLSVPAAAGAGAHARIRR